MIMRKTVNPAKLEPGMVRSWWAVLRKRKETVNAEVCIPNGQPGKLSTADDKLIKFISLQNQIMLSSPISSEQAEACGTGYTYLLLERWARIRFSWKTYSQNASAMTQKQGPGTPIVKYKKNRNCGLCLHGLDGWAGERCKQRHTKTKVQITRKHSNNIYNIRHFKAFIHIYTNCLHIFEHFVQQHLNKQNYLVQRTGETPLIV